jgi:hypothetical protein
LQKQPDKNAINLPVYWKGMVFLENLTLKPLKDSARAVYAQFLLLPALASTNMPGSPDFRQKYKEKE